MTLAKYQIFECWAQHSSVEALKGASTEELRASIQEMIEARPKRLDLLAFVGAGSLGMRSYQEAAVKDAAWIDEELRLLNEELRTR